MVLSWRRLNAWPEGARQASRMPDTTRNTATCSQTGAPSSDASRAASAPPANQRDTRLTVTASKIPSKIIAISQYRGSILCSLLSDYFSRMVVRRYQRLRGV